MVKPRSLSIALALGVALGVSCSIGDLPGNTSGGGAGWAGADSGADADASMGGDAGAAGEAGIDCSILYVSPAGDDTASGCSPAEPKKTVTAALERAKLEPDLVEIRVCAGTFDEANLTLDFPVDLSGGYACNSFQRTATYGYPTFDAVNETVIGGSQLPEALLVTGSAVAASVGIDGFTILGSSEQGALDGVAMRIEDGAAPVVSNCRIRGGSSISSSGDGSVGLSIETATPEIHSNLIDGGTGASFKPDTAFSTSGVGRVGLRVLAASPSIHHNRITGGAAAPTPSNGIASAGLMLRNAPGLTAANGKPILGNEIEGGDGHGLVEGIASAGVLAFGSTDFDLIEAVIRPGDCLTEAAVQVRAVHSEATGDIRIEKSRIYGGDLVAESKPSLGFQVGAWIENAKSFVAENDMIYGGVAKGGFAGGSPSFAIALTNVDAPVIRHCTLYSGPSGFPTVGTALKVNSATKVILQNNILAADAGWNETLYVEPCASNGVFERVENNLLFNFGDIAANLQVFGYGPVPGAPCLDWQGIATIDDLTAHLASTCSSSTPGLCQGFGGVKVSGNKTLRASCGTDSGCITWSACGNGSLACLQSIFEGWSDADNGLTTLFGPGWKLKSGIPCATATGTKDLGVDALASDLFGTPRTKPASMGAHEMDGTCTP